MRAGSVIDRATRLKRSSGKPIDTIYLAESIESRNYILCSPALCNKRDRMETKPVQGFLEIGELTEILFVTK
jgi:hypothetical protein